MADSIPQAYLKELTDTLAAESLKVAFFTNLTGYTQATGTTYAALKAGGATEVSDSGTGYTTAGYALTLASSNYSTTGAKVTATATSVSGASFTYRYSVIYNTSTGKIRFIKDHLEDKTVTSGTITITWSATNGIVTFTHAT